MTDATSRLTRKFHHVNLKTTRLQEMIDWYAELVGAEVVFQDAIGAWLSNDDANHRIALLAFPGLRRRPRQGHPHGDAPQRVRVRELRGAQRALSAPARAGHRAGDLPGSRHDVLLLLPDPDGNHVELQVDNFGDWAASREWMHTSEEFHANPIGQFVDPEQVAEAAARRRAVRRDPPQGDGG